jgi:hypothetical protein
MLRLASGIAFVLASTTAVAGFSIEGSPASSSEWGIMGQRTPYESEAKASFKSSDTKLEPRQGRYADAQLVVDLAYKAVTQKGSGQADRVDGFADDVPFATAISMIMPAGWQLYQGSDLGKKDVPETVSYIGGKAWPEVMGQLGERYALKFHLDWYDRTVMMTKGRPSAVQQASRIRIIAEPAPAAKPIPKPIPAVKASVQTPAVANAASAKSFAAGPVTAPVLTSLGGNSTALPRPVLKGQGDVANVNNNKPVMATSSPAPISKPIELKPATISIQVRSGTLHENVSRLSKENGWSAPGWGIDGDYRISAPYSIQAKDFAEAMVKLLMIHPIEADVNTAQRKIYVLKEIR